MRKLLHMDPAERQALLDEVRPLRQRGWGKCKIAQELNISQKTAQTLIWRVDAGNDYLGNFEQGLFDRFMGAVRSGPCSLIEVSDKLDVAPKKVLTLAEQAKANHFEVEWRDDKFQTVTPDKGAASINVREFFGKEIVFGAISDTHLGSRWERLDVANALYDLYQELGIPVVFHAGNIVEGEARFNRYDIQVHGIEQQTRYCVENYPQRPSVKTRFITGDDHEGWWTQREGLNFGRYLEAAAHKAGRTDLEYIGHVESDVAFEAPGGRSVLKVMHPGGGSAYALSYSVQKLIESFQGGEKPDVLLVGHYHKFDHCWVRNVHSIQVGTTQDQSIFMRKKKLAAHVGGCIVWARQSERGHFTRFRVEWVPFYDRKFYMNAYEPG